MNERPSNLTGGALDLSEQIDSYEKRLLDAHQQNRSLRDTLNAQSEVIEKLKNHAIELAQHAQGLEAQNQELRRLLDDNKQTIARFNSFVENLTYNADGIATTSKNTEFLEDPRFRRAYRRGMQSGHRINHLTDPENDLHIEWRVAIALWAATHATHLPGDFVECGTYTGILSLAICDYLNFNALDKDFYLFDTFEGVPLAQIQEAEDRAYRERVNRAWYSDCFHLAERNFSPFPRVHLVQGIVPDTLMSVEIERVSYLSIDMNIAYPERAALEHFWPRLVSGGIIVFDDHGFHGHELQKATHDDFARAHGVEIFMLPTGQGLLLKP
jgi:O-methyltransferase